jgi:starch synthase
MRAHELDKGEAVNILKGAMVTADRIMTVSQGYAWEITTPEGTPHPIPSQTHSE